MGSSSTYKSDFVSSLPERPSNGGAYLCILVGLLAFGVAWLLGSGEDGAHGIALILGIFGVVFVLGGIVGRKSGEKLSAAPPSSPSFVGPWIGVGGRRLSHFSSRLPDVMNAHRVWRAGAKSSAHRTRSLRDLADGNLANTAGLRP